VLEAAKSQPYFSDTALAGVRKFLEDPMAWSAAHGGVANAAEALALKQAK
jgi:orotate phosphoribosyltransferase